MGEKTLTIHHFFFFFGWFLSLDDYFYLLIRAKHIHKSWYKIKQQNETERHSKIHELHSVSLKSQSTLLEFCFQSFPIGLFFFLNHNSLLPFSVLIYVDNLIILFFSAFLHIAIEPFLPLP